MADSSSSNKEQALVISFLSVFPLNCINALESLFLLWIQELQCIVCGMQLVLRISENKTHQLDGVVSILVQYALLLATYVA